MTTRGRWTRTWGTSRAACPTRASSACRATRAPPAPCSPPASPPRPASPPAPPPPPRSPSAPPSAAAAATESNKDSGREKEQKPAGLQGRGRHSAARFEPPARTRQQKLAAHSRRMRHRAPAALVDRPQRPQRPPRAAHVERRARRYQRVKYGVTPAVELSERALLRRVDLARD
eukprot:4400119-Prymnesium_polylepis.1